MNSWLDFEARFVKLAPALQYARIDDQTGAAGEHWRIAGIPTNSETVRQFELMCLLAGDKITELQACSSELLDHPDPKIRWYRLLKQNSASYQRDFPCYETDEKGNNLGAIHGGTIYHIGEGSANLCLQLHATHPIKPNWYEILYQDYAKQIIIGIILLLVGAAIGIWID